MIHRRTPQSGPFRAETFATIPGRSASIYREGEFFTSDLEADAAKRLAALLNEAEAVADLMANSGGIGHARTRLAFAVAKAMGREINWSQASKAEAA